MTLSDIQIRKLKQLAHHLKPVVLLGAHGLTENVHREIDLALHSHELIKIKLNAKDKATKDALAQTICDYHDATFVSMIGHILIIFRQSDESD